MRHDLTVSETIVVNATPEKAWKALTDPALIKKYLYGTNTQTDWKPGSDIVFEGEYNGQKYRDHGKILENETHRKISYSYWSGFSGLEDKPENYARVGYKLKDLDKGTCELTWSQSGFANEEGQKHSQSGMKEFLKSLKEVIEGQ